MKHKKPFTDDLKMQLIKSTQVIEILSECISIEFQQTLFDTKFKQAAINNHARRIKESTQAIQTHLSSLVKNKDREFFAYDYCTEVYTLFKFFTTMPLEQIQDTIKQIEELNKEAV